MSLTSDQIIDITSYINAYRAKHSAPPLKWNSTIASFSQQWSDYLLSKNLFQHSGSQLYGENLAYFEGYGSDLINLIKMSVDAWYNEVSLYDFNKPGFSAATGHFTCLVWLASKENDQGHHHNEYDSARERDRTISTKCSPHRRNCSDTDTDPCTHSGPCSNPYSDPDPHSRSGPYSYSCSRSDPYSCSSSDPISDSSTTSYSNVT